jgi:hypothetical protein
MRLWKYIVRYKKLGKSQKINDRQNNQTIFKLKTSFEVQQLI